MVAGGRSVGFGAAVAVGPVGVVGGRVGRRGLSLPWVSVLSAGYVWVE